MTSPPLTYPVRLEPAFIAGFFVTCRDLPGVMTHGDDVADALRQAANTLALHVFEHCLTHGKPPFASEALPGEVLVQVPLLG